MCKTLWVALLLLGSLWPNLGYSATYNWTNAAGGNWNVPSNWNPNGVPGSADSATIASNTVTVNADVIIANLVLTNTGAITGPANLSINNSFSWGGGTNLGTGKTIILSSATATINGSLKNIAGRTIEIQGTATWTAGNISISSGAFNVAASGVFTIQTSSGSSISGTSLTNGVFNNLGTVKKSSSGTVSFSNFGAFNNQGTLDLTNALASTSTISMSVPFNNSGVARASSGTINTLLALNSGGLSSGKFVADGFGKINFNNGTHTLTNAMLTGSGTNVISLAALEIAGNVVASTLEMNGGSLNGSGLLTVTNRLVWAGSFLSGNGSTLVAPSASLELKSGILAGRNFLLNGNGELKAPSAFQLNSGSFTVNVGGLLDLQTDASIVDADGPTTASALLNLGTIRKNATDGTTGIGVDSFSNFGKLEIRRGVVSVTNLFLLATNSILHFAASGTNAPNEHGQLALGSHAFLNGNLEISFTNGFTPETNALLTLLTYPSATNFFAHISAPLPAYTTIYYHDKLQFQAGVDDEPTSFLEITTQPADQSVGEGDMAYFFAGVSGTGSITYQWRKDGYDLVDDDRISGAQSPLLFLHDVTSSDAGIYDLQVSNGTLTTNSAPATLTVTNRVAQCIPAPSGLVSWWQAESNAHDTLQLNPAALFGTTFFEGKVGTAFDFDGWDDYALVAESSSLKLQQFTIEAWVYPDTLASDWNTIAAIGATGSGPLGQFGDSYFLAFYNGHPEFTTFHSTGEDVLRGAHAVPINEWYHLAATYDGVTKRLYVNGIEVTNRSVSGNIVYESGVPFLIGADFNHGAVANEILFDGMIDEVSVYNRALSTAEVQSIYRADLFGKCLEGGPCVPTPFGITGLWRGDGNAMDSVNANHGVVGGAGYGPGKVQQAFTFDGNDDYVSVNLPALSGSFTLEAWVKFDGNSFGRASYNTILEFGNDAPWFGVNSIGQLELHPNLEGGAVPTNEWVHVAYTWDGVSGQLYLDGGVVASNSIAPPMGGTGMGIGYNAGDTPWLGSIDEVGVYNRALSLAEIQSIYFAAEDGKCGGVTTSNLPPMVHISQPSNGDTFAAPASFMVSASVSDPNGPVAKVEIFNSHDVLIATLTNEPYELSVIDYPAGTYSFRFVATDPQGLTGADSVTVHVEGDCVPAPNGILARYKGDHSADDFYYQHNGVYYDGGYSVSGNYDNGKVEDAFSFDGIDDYVSISNSLPWDFEMRNFSIELWANFTSTNGRRTLVASDEGSGNLDKWIFWLDNGSLQFHFNGSSGNQNIGFPFSPATNQWYHLAVTRTEAGPDSFYTFYTNGVVAAVVTNSAAIPAVDVPLTIGWSEGSYFFHGLIDDVAFYNRGLSTSEIRAIYEAGGSGKCVSPLQTASTLFFGGTGDQIGTGISVSDGAVYLSGTDFSGGNGPEGMIGKLVASTNDSFIPLWATNWPGRIGNDRFNALALAPDGTLYAAGESISTTVDTFGTKDSKGVLVKYATNGPLGLGLNGSLWMRQVPTNSAFNFGGVEKLNAAATAQEGTNTFIYVTGEGQNSSQNRRLFLSKVKSDSTVVWTVTDSASAASAADFSSGRAITVMNGEIYVTGQTTENGVMKTLLRKYDAQGNLLWSDSQFDGRFNGITMYGGFIYAVGQSSTNFHEADFVMAKFDAAGRLRWHFAFGQSDGGEDVLNAVVGLGNRMYAVGSVSTYDEGRNVALLEIDPVTGSLIAFNDEGGSGDDIAHGLATDGTDLFVVGETASMGQGREIALLRLKVSQPVQPFQLLTESLPRGQLNVPYVGVLEAAGVNPPFEWVLSTNAVLPPGLTLFSNGVISGIPMQTGRYDFSVVMSYNPVRPNGTGPVRTLRFPPFGFTIEIVESNALPAVQIINPENGDDFSATNYFTLIAEASDADGYVDRVEFYQNGVFIGTGGNPVLTRGGKASVANAAGVGGGVGTTVYTLDISNLPLGSYQFKAVAYDDFGASSVSAPISIRVNAKDTTVIDFEKLDARTNPVVGLALSNYLAGYGLTLTNESSSSIISVYSDDVLNGGGVAKASSGDNLLTQNGSGKISYRIDFANSVASFGFTRVQLLAGSQGVSHPDWRVTAYDSTGTELGTVGEDRILSYTNVPAKFFRLDGPNIAWVRIEADDLYFTDFHSPLLDDLTLINSIANIAPVVSITSPTNGQSFTAPANVTVTALASDSDGSISEIRFYSGNYLFATESGYGEATATLSGLAAGSYTLRAVAEDNDGAVRSSVPVTFTVNSVPGVNVINFDALDASTRNVGGQILSNYLAPFGVAIDGMTRGSRVEAASAKNLFSGRAVSAPSPENIFSQFGVAGPVSFTLKFATPQQSVRFTRASLKADGGEATHPWWVARAFDASGNEIASVGEPLIVSASDVDASVFELTAPGIVSVRFDSNDREQAAFNAVLIDDLVLNTNPVPVPLNVNLTSPANGTVLTNGDITLTAEATATGRTIARVEFYAGPVFIDSATSASSIYSIVWKDVLPGNYTIRARVVDTTGAARISPPITITVVAGVGGNSAIVNFDPLNAAGGSVTGAVLNTYLASFGITVTNATPATRTEVRNQTSIFLGKTVEASSSPNLFTQTGVGAQVGFALKFSNVLGSFSFTRPKLIAGNNGITHPAWRATAYNPYGVPLATVSEDFISSYFDVVSRKFTLTGLGIASVRFESDNRQYAAFNAVLLDDLILTASTSNLPPVVQIISPASGASYFTPASFSITARALDADGSVAQVKFYARSRRGDVSLLGAATSATGEFTISLNGLAAGEYTVFAQAIDNLGTQDVSQAISVTVQPAPDAFGILEQPQDLELATGETAEFSVTTTDIGLPVTFQWFITDAQTFTNAILGATNASLILPNVTGANIALYFVQASSGGVTVTSETASLNVVNAPFITSHPESQTVVGGENVTFSVTATGAGTLKYQWLLNGNAISGATSSSLTLSNVQPFDSGKYSVVVGNSIGVAVSDEASLLVTLGNGVLNSADNFADRVSINPLFSATLGNNCAATKEPGEPNHAGRRGANSIWFTWHATFTGVISLSTRGSSFDTLLAVYTGSDVANLTLVASDDDSAGYLNSRVTFNCMEGFDYHIAVDGFNGACGYVVLSLPTGGYRVLDSGSSEEIPTITQQPVSQNVSAGANVTLTVSANSLSPLIYQWFYNDTPILSATESTFTISNITSSAVGSYFAQVVNDYGSVDSALADIQIVSAEVTNANEVASQDKFGSALDSGIESSAWHSTGKAPTAYAGTSRGFTSTQIFNTTGNSKEQGEPNHCGEPGGKSQWFTYQSPTNGVIQISTDGSTFNTVLAVYRGSGLGFSDLISVTCDKSSSGNGGDRVRFNATAGTVYFIAVDGVGGAGGIVQLNISLGEPPTITSQPQSQPAALGGNSTFSVGATGSTNLTFQWQFNGANISSATNSAYTRINVESNHVGGYRVILSNSVNVVTSSVASLFLSAPPEITQHPLSTNVNTGATVTFTVVATGAQLRYQWRFNDGNLLNKTNSSLTLSNVQVTNAGFYSVLITNTLGSVLSSNAALTIAGTCTIAISPASTNYPASGGSGVVNVTTTGCAWGVTNTNAWINISSGGDGGIGNGTVTYVVAENLGNAARTGAVNIAGRTFTVTQAGAFSAGLLAGKTITFTNLAGANGFATNGALLFVTGVTNNSFRTIWISGPTNNTAGTYTYTQINSSTGQIVTNDTVITLSFASRTSGTYTSTNPVSSGNQSGTFALAPSGPDFNGDGRVDLVLQYTDRRQAAWFLRGTAFVSSAAVGGAAPPAGWLQVGQADFNGDGRVDLLLQNSSSGKLTVWYLNGTARIGSQLIRNGATPGTAWKAVAAADFNGDGKPDILLQHKDSRLTVWYQTGTNGTASLGSSLLRNGTKAAGLAVVGTGDFNGDGLTDVLFQNTSSRKMSVWHMNNTSFISSASIRGGVAPAAGWKASAVADLNGDGRSDIILQHTNTKIAVWHMNRAALINSVTLRNGKTAPGWRLAGPK